MKHACVIGWPVEHSRSPVLHGYWLKKYGIDGAYTKRAVAPEAVAGFLQSLRANGYVGCNVTVPHKAAHSLPPTKEKILRKRFRQPIRFGCLMANSLPPILIPTDI